MENKHVSLNESLLKDDEDKEHDGKLDLDNYIPSGSDASGQMNFNDGES
jgi:hypothetical protein